MLGILVLSKRKGVTMMDFDEFLLLFLSVCDDVKISVEQTLIEAQPQNEPREKHYDTIRINQ